MITYNPAYIVRNHFGWCCYDRKQPQNLLPLYEYFARMVLDLNLPREVLIDTSGRGHTEFGCLCSMKDVSAVLVRLFLCVSGVYPEGGADLLRAADIRRWSDLAKPIAIRGMNRDVNISYDVRERRLKQPGPNTCHPGAIYGQSAWFVFSAYRRRWCFCVSYGYSRDSSSWSICTEQEHGESLYAFCRRIPAYLDSVFEPEQWDGHRKQANHDWDRIEPAVCEVFGWDGYTDEMCTDEALARFILTHQKPRLTPERLREIQGWVRSDRRKEKRRGRKRG